MATKVLTVPPPHVPGKGMSEAMAHANYMVKSDAVNYNDSSPVAVFTAPANTLIISVVCQIVTVFNGLVPSLSLGISGATERHLALADIDVKTAGFYVSVAPFDYTALTSIIATIVPSTASQGVARFWVRYRPYSNVQ